MGPPTTTTGQQVIVLRVVVRAPDLDGFITRYSRHLDGDRIFIFTKSPQPPGTRVRFSLHLSSGEQLIAGKGTVTRVQADAGDPRHPPGMELAFVPLDDRSQTLIDFMLATRAGAVESTASVPPIVGAVLRPIAPKPPATLPPLPPTRETPIVQIDPPSPPALAAPPPSPPVAVAPPPDSPALAAPLPESPIFAAPPPAVIASPEPVSPGPAPSFAEGWRTPIVPGAPLDSSSGEVPANPFSEVSDGAIEYFVEWSLEQSIGPRREPSASFSNVAMSLPGEEREPPIAARRQRPWLLAAGFLVGVPAGCLLWALLRPTPKPALATRAAHVAAPPASAAAPPPATPTAIATATASAAPAPRTAVAAAARSESLRVITRPPGAAVTIDGKPAGQSPLTVALAPGPHQIEATKERYRAAHAEAEAPGELAIDLHRPLATLRLTSTPSAAAVTVEGVARGRTPIALRLAGYQKYDVQVALPGVRPWRRAVYLKGPTVAVKATLQPIARAAPPRARR